MPKVCNDGPIPAKNIKHILFGRITTAKSIIQRMRKTQIDLSGVHVYVPARGSSHFTVHKTIPNRVPPAVPAWITRRHWNSWANPAIWPSIEWTFFFGWPIIFTSDQRPLMCLSGLAWAHCSTVTTWWWSPPDKRARFPRKLYYYPTTHSWIFQMRCQVWQFGGELIGTLELCVYYHRTCHRLKCRGVVWPNPLTSNKIHP